MHSLFDQFAHRYDLHTPPDHYKHDHQLVLDLAAEQGPGCRILDIGCGTGVLVEKARAAGFEAYGLDASEAMIAVARTRVSADVVRVQRMQELDEVERYDLIVLMSWSIHYCADEEELTGVVRRIVRALVPGGRLLLQAAHAANLNDEWMEDCEDGPTGEPDDIHLRFRFRREAARSAPTTVNADYSFRCGTSGEAFEETHQLRICDANVLQGALSAGGLDDATIWDGWKRNPLARSSSPFITARRAPR